MSRLILMLLLAIPLSCGDGSGVYLCTGPRTKVYHKTDRCKGLRRCSGTIKKVDVAYAEKIGRRKCKMCY